MQGAERVRFWGGGSVVKSPSNNGVYDGATKKHLVLQLGDGLKKISAINSRGQGSNRLQV